jgi:hypothetical protein
MGRPSKLTDDQWKEIGSRLLNGEKASDLGNEYGVSKTRISIRFSKRNETVRGVAEKIVEAETAVMSLAPMEQARARTLAENVLEISNHLSCAARYGSATAHRLQALAHGEVQKIDDSNPLESIEALKGVQALTRLANDAASTGLNLLAANKDMQQQKSTVMPLQLNGSDIYG